MVYDALSFHVLKVDRDLEHLGKDVEHRLHNSYTEIILLRCIKQHKTECLSPLPFLYHL